jgi:hypothetical protein
MPLIHDKHGYSFGRIPGNPLPGNQFQHAGKTWEIIDSPITGNGRYDQDHYFREVGTKQTFKLSMKQLIHKLTGETI